MPFAQTFHGHKSFLQCMTSFKQAFPDLTMTITNQVVTEDQVPEVMQLTTTSMPAKI